MQNAKKMVQLTAEAAMLLVLSVFPFTIPHRQAIEPRHDYGALLEPRGRILTGAGQDWPAFSNYWNVMHPTNKPAVYMTYIGLRDARSDWTEELKRDLLAYPGQCVVPQIGLSMTTDGNPSVHYEQKVAAGMYDNEIEMFLDGLQALAMPAYVRIGYEFNGMRWNGYFPDSYRAAFVRITDRIRARGLEVATVWDFSMDGDMNFEDYYPGDRYVDWWGINIYFAGDFSRPAASRFLDSADIHRKPVMIGETSPRHVGTLNGTQSWDKWFVPLFTFIHTNPGVKMFCYINWDWSQYPQWHNWGDARLEQNTVVRSLFAGEMDSAEYLHASPESMFRRTFGSTDTAAPPAPSDFSIISNEYPVTLSWNPVSDPSDISHYIMYKNGVLADYTLTIPYQDRDVSAGELITYAVSAMDRAGNESPVSRNLPVTIAPQLEKPINGEFDEGKTAWWLDSDNYGSVSAFDIDTTSAVSGKNSARITITQPGNTSPDVALFQVLRFARGRTYRVTFKGKASVRKGIDLIVVQNEAPFTVYHLRRFNLTTNVQSFTDSVSIGVTNHASLLFAMGGPPIGQVWIDAVSVLESQPVR
jgi:hypothetical protein